MIVLNLYQHFTDQMNKVSFLILFLFILIVPANAQKKNVKAADEAFAAHKYATAIDHYRKAYTKIKNDVDEKNRINFQLAECYRLTNNVNRAEIQYKRLEKIKYQEKEPIILLHLANALLSNKKYKEASIQYKAYQQVAPNDPRGANGISSSATAAEWEKTQYNYVVENLKKINSKEDDFSPAYANSELNTIVFTSGRSTATGNQKDEWTDQDFSDLFITRVDAKGNFTIPVLFDNLEGNLESDLTINTGGNEGTPQLNNNFSTIYFTRCPASGTKNQGCKIYTSERNGRNWSRPKPLQFGNDSSSVVGHPTISSDELTIYFTSDSKNGYGGRDIWMSKRKNKNEAFGKPQNPGPEINTPGDEMFPYLRNDTLLYFSSNGHVGMGGLDIYRATFKSGWGNVINLKAPFNSNNDDFGIIFNPEKEEGFFSSNRKGSRKDDLYSFYQPILEYSIEGTVKNENSLQFIEGAEISLLSSSGTKHVTLTNANGKYQFGTTQIKPNQTYEISASKADFFIQKHIITSENLTNKKKFKQDFDLTPFPSEPILLPEILYDLGKWELKTQYQDSLQDLIKTMDENKNLVIELASHTDSRDTDERNDILSQRRARSVVEYLILRGIDPDRLVAKGYGERQPREFKQNLIKNGITFRKGSKLTEEFINGLRSNAEKEAAHELNRRTEFRILNKDFEQKTSKAVLNPDKVNINLNPVTNEITFMLEAQTGVITAKCLINDHAIEFSYQENYDTEISLRQALKLLNDGEIDKNDFVGDVEMALANGTIANQSIFKIKKLTIADKTIGNIEVMVNNRIKNSFQFGSSILSKFGNFTIDKEAKKIIFQ